MKIKLLVLFFLVLIFHASAQDFINAKGIVVFKLIKVPQTNIFALSESVLIIKGTKFNLGNGAIFINSSKFLVDSLQYRRITEAANSYDVYDTKLFRDSVNRIITDNEINYGGELYVSKTISNSRLDTIYIAYNIKANFIVYDSSSGSKIVFNKLHCYANKNIISYPVYVPLHIKKYYKLSKKQVRTLSLKKNMILQYVFRDCD